MKVGVVGGSLAGLFSAILLRAQGHEVVVHERSGSDLFGRGAGLVGGRELFEAMRRIGCSHVAGLSVDAHLQISLDRLGRVVAERPVAASRFSWDLLYRTARAKLGDGCYRSSRPVVAVEDGDDGATIRFADGDDRRYDLVIGADGIASVTRLAVEPDGPLPPTPAMRPGASCCRRSCCPPPRNRSARR